MVTNLIGLLVILLPSEFVPSPSKHLVWALHNMGARDENLNYIANNLVKNPDPPKPPAPTPTPTTRPPPSLHLKKCDSVCLLITLDAYWSLHASSSHRCPACDPVTCQSSNSQTHVSVRRTNRLTGPASLGSLASLGRVCSSKPAELLKSE